MKTFAETTLLQDRQAPARQTLRPRPFAGALNRVRAANLLRLKALP